MKILFWCEPFWPVVGGIPSLAEDLVASLAQRGHQVHVVADEPAPASPSRQTRSKVPIHRFPFLDALRSGSGARILSLSRDVGELERGIGADAVLAYALTPSLFFHHQARQSCPAPLMVTLHGALPAHPETGESMVGRTLMAADWVMTCSRNCLERAVASYPLIASKASVALNALGQDVRPPTAVTVDPLRLLYAGRLSPEKGVDDAIRALEAVRRRRPDAQLRIAGEGPLSGVLRDLAAARGLADAVEFRGFVAREELHGLLSASSLVVVPSRSEGFSLVALEAARAGRPVVATRVDGIPEVVVDGETGLLVPPDSPAALATAILRLAADAAAAQTMGTNARRRAIEAFRWSDYVDAYDHRLRVLGGAA